MHYRGLHKYHPHTEEEAKRLVKGLLFIIVVFIVMEILRYKFAFVILLEAFSVPYLLFSFQMDFINSYAPIKHKPFIEDGSRFVAVFLVIAFSQFVKFLGVNETTGFILGIVISVITIDWLGEKKIDADLSIERIEEIKSNYGIEIEYHEGMKVEDVENILINIRNNKSKT